MLTFRSVPDRAWYDLEDLDASLKRSYPAAVTEKAGHTYRLSCDYMVDDATGGSGDMLSVQLGGGSKTELDLRVTKADVWCHTEATGTLPAGAAETGSSILIYNVDSHARTWRLRNLRFGDITG